MTYINPEELARHAKGNPAFIESLKQDVETYFENFSDSPSNTSEWGHHYFCKQEGGRLIYDPKEPKKHVCSICGEVYSNELLNGVWHTMYRNQGVVQAWKSAMLYRLYGDQQYLDNVINYATFYNTHYTEFALHNKEGVVSDSPESAVWGTARIMPQSLNESIFIIRLISALELLGESCPKTLIQELHSGMFTEIFTLLKPQVHQIHNIPSWLNCGIGVMGLFCNNKEMIDFAFNGKLGILRQMEEGVTSDGFWYEGSIHYNFFFLEGLTNLLLFSSLKGYSFPQGEAKVAEMLEAAYWYAFENHQLPNPNDGWPDINLKTYSYIYANGVKVLGEDSLVGKMLGSILNNKEERATLPLSKPYFYKNDISLEEFLFVPGLRNKHTKIIPGSSKNYTTSYCGLLKQSKTNLFLKYGHNGPSHAHPDKMHLELILDDTCISRDLSNSGYGNPHCDAWHRVTASHNTVVVNGENHTGFEGGETLISTEDTLKVRAESVYPGVTYTRHVAITEKSMEDSFSVDLPEEAICDYIFHVEGEPITELASKDGELGFDQNGYQYFTEVREILCKDDVTPITWNIKGRTFQSNISCKDAQLFLMRSPDNPIVNYRTTILVRMKSKNPQFSLRWEVLS